MGKVVVCGRLSKKGEEADLERQLRLCRARADEEGWEIVGEYVDNGTSGYRRGVKRPQYEAMLEALDGSAEVLSYNLDRLFRQDSERLRFYNVYRAEGLRYVRFVDGQDADLSSADGQKYFRDLGSAAEHQSARASERLRRKAEELSQNGHRWGGRRPFGYEKDMSLEPRESQAIRQGADMVLGGASAHQVAVTWNGAGVLRPGGGRWTSGKVQKVLSAALIAGLREHRRTDDKLNRDGQVVGKVVTVVGVYQGSWPGIVTREEHQALRSLLARKRTRSPGSLARRHPMSGILRCAECEQAMEGRTQPDGRRSYACPEGHNAVGANAVEDTVLDAVQAADPQYLRKQTLTSPTTPDATVALALAAVEDRRTRAMSVQRDEGVDMTAALAKLEREEAALREQVQAADRPSDPEKDDPERRARRHAGELTEAEVLQTHDWVAALVDTVEVRRARSTREAAAGRIAINWR